MKYEEFAAILEEEGIDRKDFIDAIWKWRPCDTLDENRVREAARHALPVFIILAQLFDNVEKHARN